MELMKRLQLSIFSKKLDDSGEGSGSSFFIKNGSKLLEELITQWGGRIKIHLRNYSSKDLAQATHNFDYRGLVTEDCHFRIYNGSFDKYQILVKTYYSDGFWDHHIETFAIRDIVISSHMSFHKNVLKLIGYCLDYEYPTLVYQSPETCETLDYYLLNTELTWQSKLSLASDIAYILAYLHTGFQTPIIQRNMKLGHFVIDNYGTAKFADFSFCISIPLGESQVEDTVMGTTGIMDPVYAITGVLTEKTDVYNFGVVLIELLTRRRFCNESTDSRPNYTRNNITRVDVEGIMNGNTVMEGEMGRNEEVRVIAALALNCVGDDRETRPEMVDVAKELRKMQRFIR